MHSNMISPLPSFHLLPVSRESSLCTVLLCAGNFSTLCNDNITFLSRRFLFLSAGNIHYKLAIFNITKGHFLSPIPHANELCQHY